MTGAFRKLDGSLVEIDGLFCPVEVEWTEELDEPAVEVRLRLRVEGDRYVVKEMTLGGRPEITSETLRRLPLRAVAVRAEERAIDEFLPDQDQAGSDLAVAVLAYRLGLRASEAPVQYVMESLGVSRATASRRIAEARELGLLRDDERAPRGAAAARRSRRVSLKQGEGQ